MMPESSTSPNWFADSDSTQMSRAEPFAQEHLYHLASLSRVLAVDSHLAEEILHAALVHDHESAQTVKQIVQRKDALGAALGTLVIQCYE